MSLPTTKIIAIIDQDFRLRRYLERLLAASGYATESFAAAEEFLAEVEIREPACLVLDIALKDSSGRELAHHPTVRALRCPIIFTSATANEELQRQSLQLSGAPVLRKPFRAVDILPRIIEAIGTRQ